MDIRTPPRILEYPQGKSYSTFSPVQRSASGIRAKIREKSFPESPGFYYLSAVRLFVCAATGVREDSVPFPSERRITRCFSRGTENSSESRARASRSQHWSLLSNPISSIPLFLSSLLSLSSSRSCPKFRN